MNALCSPFAKTMMVIVGYVAAISAARAAVRGFDFRMSRIIGRLFAMDLTVSVALFLACLALFIVSVWYTHSVTRGYTPVKQVARADLSLASLRSVWNGMDFPQLALMAFTAMLACWSHGRNFLTTAKLLALPLTAYLSFMLLAGEFTARLRDKRLIGTLYLYGFFKRYPVWRGTGLIMALLLTGPLAYILAVFPFYVLLMRVGQAGLWEAAYALVSYALLTGVCRTIMYMRAERDTAAEERIKAERFKAELITNVSHDIRTPLTSIINYVDLLRNLPIEDAVFAEYTGVLEKKAARLNILIGDLMEASKAGTGNMRVDLREIDLNEMVGQLAGEFDDAFAEHGLTLVLRQTAEPVLVRADSGHLWRSLENLLSNAVKYSLPGTRVFTEVSQQPEITLTVRNTSMCPIDLPGEADTLTEQFMRGDRARHTEGSGLGLYIAKSLVELMGGRLTIRTTGDLFEAEVTLTSDGTP